MGRKSFGEEKFNIGLANIWGRKTFGIGKYLDENIWGRKRDLIG